VADSFRFAFDRLARIVLAPAGIWPATAVVRISDDEFSVRYGAWRLTTPLANLIAAEVTGPYSWLRAVGPHLSVSDGGVTFGTNADAGVCVRFRSPVPALLPGDWLRHSGVTVTVAQPQALVSRLGLPT
jgi:hypothetical protein